MGKFFRNLSPSPTRQPITPSNTSSSGRTDRQAEAACVAGLVIPEFRVSGISGTQKCKDRNCQLGPGSALRFARDDNCKSAQNSHEPAPTGVKRRPMGALQRDRGQTKKQNLSPSPRVLSITPLTRPRGQNWPTVRGGVCDSL